MAEAVAELSPEEKRSILYHLGWFQAESVGTIALGIPTATQPMLLVYSQMERIPVSAVGRIRTILAHLDNLDAILMGPVVERLAARKVEDIQLNEEEPAAIEREIVRWAKRLSEILGAPWNPNSARFSGGDDGRIPLTVPVR